MTDEKTLVDALATLDIVERIAPWKDRHYISLAAARGSRANADLRTKIWLRADLLTIEAGKGYHSEAYIAAQNALAEAVTAAGGTIRTI